MKGSSQGMGAGGRKRVDNVVHLPSTTATVMAVLRGGPVAIVCGGKLSQPPYAAVDGEATQ